MTPPRPAMRPISPPAGTLECTAEVFASRMQRRIKEQEAKQTESKKADESRRTLLLQAMTTVRKALAATARISMGDRFSFALEVGDWEGWPRVDLLLIDALAPGRSEHALIITAYDRKGTGTIQMSLRNGEALARLHVDDPAELEKLPLLLKKTVREFLDIVAEYVLNPKSPEELLEVQSKPLDHALLDDSGEVSGELDRLSKEDLFGQEFPEQDKNRVDLAPEVRPLEL
jgi:hypothetical protein